MIQCATSHIPMGRTSGHLSKAMRQQALYAATELGQTNDELSFLATDVEEAQRSPEAHLKEVHSLFQL